MQGVRDDHTYAKPYGSDGPDVRVTGHSPGDEDAIFGDTIQRAVAGTRRRGPPRRADRARPGTYDVQLLRDGAWSTRPR